MVARRASGSRSKGNSPIRPETATYPREHPMANGEGDGGSNEPRQTRDGAKILLDEMHGVYQAVHDRVESFEDDNLGADLAYLLGAMLKGSSCSWPADRPFVLVL